MLGLAEKVADTNADKRKLRVKKKLSAVLRPNRHKINQRRTDQMTYSVYPRQSQNTDAS